MKADHHLQHMMLSWWVTLPMKYLTVIQSSWWEALSALCCNQLINYSATILSLVFQQTTIWGPRPLITSHYHESSIQHNRAWWHEVNCIRINIHTAVYVFFLFLKKLAINCHAIHLRSTVCSWWTNNSIIKSCQTYTSMFTHTTLLHLLPCWWHEVIVVHLPNVNINKYCCPTM